MMRVSCLAVLLLGLGTTGASSLAGDYWFGNGCFWRVQHLFTTKFEQVAPQNRSGAMLTATAGYAAGADMPDPTCYHNDGNVNVYSDYGAAETVRLRIDSAEQLAAAGLTYFAEFMSIGPVGPNGTEIWTRPDYLDQGPEYRALIGIPGGAKNTEAMGILNRSDVNLHSFALKLGTLGSDPDTLVNNTVYIYDSSASPFRPAKLCMQYHDDSSGVYPPEYHAIQGKRKATGSLKDTSCPIPAPCPSL